jgi:hypothetical protein
LPAGAPGGSLLSALHLRRQIMAKKILVPIAAVGMALFVVRCGSPVDNGADVGTQTHGDGQVVTGSDGSTQTGDGSTASNADGSTQTGLDAGSSTGLDASSQAGLDASSATGLDASTGVCDPFAKTGCTSPQKCTLNTGTFAYECAAAGAKTDQQDCTADTECANGLFCAKVGTETSAKCRSFCDQTHTCVAGQACVVAVQTGHAPILCAVVPACDPFATPTGCTSPQKCTLIDATGPVYSCGPAGTGGDLTACTDDSKCAAGLVCVKFSPSDPMLCHALCSAAKPCPTTPDESCIGADHAGQTPFLCVPTPQCNPLTQDCTGAGQGCYPASQSPPKWACVGNAGKNEGASCTSVNECKPGFVCAGSAGSGTCRKICDPAGGAPTCTTGSCQAYIAPAGVCP